MEYQGKELTEFKPTETVFFNPPKRMLVWDSNSSEPTGNDVVAFITSRENFPVVAVRHTWMHCAEIPEQKLASNRELSRWLAEGKGEVMDQDGLFTSWFYWKGKEDSPVKDSLFVRKWKDTEWRKPTREYLELEDK